VTPSFLAGRYKPHSELHLLRPWRTGRAVPSKINIQAGLVRKVEKLGDFSPRRIGAVLLLQDALLLRVQAWSRRGSTPQQRSRATGWLSPSPPSTPPHTVPPSPLDPLRHQQFPATRSHSQASPCTPVELQPPRTSWGSIVRAHAKVSSCRRQCREHRSPTYLGNFRQQRWGGWRSPHHAGAGATGSRDERDRTHLATASSRVSAAGIVGSWGAGVGVDAHVGEDGYVNLTQCRWTRPHASRSSTRAPCTRRAVLSCSLDSGKGPTVFE